MSSKDDEKPKTAASLYEKAIGDKALSYANLMQYASNNGDKDLVQYLSKQDIFDSKTWGSKEAVIKLLESHYEKLQSKNNTPATWTERIKSQEKSRNQSQNQKK